MEKDDGPKAATPTMGGFVVVLAIGLGIVLWAKPGPMVWLSLLALAWFESRRKPSGVEQVVTRVGRVPLFFYLWQWPLAHGLAVLLSAAAGKEIGYYFLSPPAVFAAAPPNAGFDLPIVYLCWAVVLAVLIPMCLWFARVKASHPAWWLKYL